MAGNTVYVQGSYIDVHDNKEVNLNIDKAMVTVQESDGENDSTDKPKELPYELSTPTAMGYWKKLRDGGWVDEHWQRTELMTRSAAGYTVFCFSKVLNLEGGWSVFEDFWGCKNLRQEFDKTQNKLPKKCERLKFLFGL